MLRTFGLRRTFSSRAYNSSKDYYKILNVAKSANNDEIKKAFRELAKKYHPDSNQGKEDLFKQINEAYQVLSSQETRNQYDQVRGAEKSSDSKQNYQQRETQNQHQFHRNPYDYPFSQGNNRNRYNPNSYEQNYGQNSQKNKHQKNMNSRDQFMYQMFRQQQSDFIRQYQQHQRNRQFQNRRNQSQQSMENQYLRRYHQAMNNREEEKQRRYNERIKQYEKDYEDYVKRFNQKYGQGKAEETVNKVSEGFSQFGSFVKQAWNLWKNSKKQK